MAKHGISFPEPNPLREKMFDAMEKEHKENEMGRMRESMREHENMADMGDALLDTLEK